MNAWQRPHTRPLCQPKRKPPRLGKGTAGNDQVGQAIVWVAVMMPLLLSVVGLAIDGGLVFSARRELQNVADAAARAGAMQIDLQRYRASLGTSVELDTDRAKQVAAAYVAAHGLRLQVQISPERQRIVVEVSRAVPTSFLRLAGITTVHLSATSPAEARYGIDRGNR